MHDYAKRELDRLNPPGYDGRKTEWQEWIEKDILELIDVFSKQGHSNSSGAYALSLFDRLIRGKPLTALTGEEDEWGDPYGYDDTNTQQNKRCSSVFRTHFDNNTAYDIDAKVFSDDGGKTWWSSRESMTKVIFPYMPPKRPEKIIIDRKL